MKRGYGKLLEGRFSDAQAVYFITSNTIEKEKLFVGKPSGACGILMDSIRWMSENNLWEVHGWVIMPDHVHMLLNLAGSASLSNTMNRWKGFTGRSISQLLKRKGIWQQGYFDHVVRDETNYLNCLNYMALNPVKRGLVKNWKEWKLLMLPDGFEAWESKPRRACPQV